MSVNVSPVNMKAKQSRCHLINHPDVDVVIMIASLTDDIEYGSAKVSYFLRLSATDINLNHLRQNHPISCKKKYNIIGYIEVRLYKMPSYSYRKDCYLLTYLRLSSPELCPLCFFRKPFGF